jgi:hypothetical protein
LINFSLLNYFDSMRTLLIAFFVLLPSACCAPFPGNSRGEFIPPLVELSRYRVESPSAYFQFSTSVRPPVAKRFKEFLNEPGFMVDISPDDKWVPAFELENYLVVYSDNFKHRQCKWLHENFGETSRAYNSLFMDFYKGCVRDRDYLLVLDRAGNTIGWSRIGRIRDCNNLRNPLPVEPELWKVPLLLVKRE